MDSDLDAAGGGTLPPVVAPSGRKETDGEGDGAKWWQSVEPDAGLKVGT